MRSHRAPQLMTLPLLLALTSACTSDEGGSEHTAADEGTVEIYSWWMAGGEAQALSHLIGQYATRHPGREVLNSTSMDSVGGPVENAFATMKRRLAEDDPPDAWQAILGSNLLDYTRFAPLGSEPGAPTENMTRDLSDLYESEGWLDKMPAAVLDAMRDGDGIYAVPLSINRINELFYNKAVFRKYGLTAPRTLDELWAVGEALKDAVDTQGRPIIPLVIAAGYGDSAWPVRFVADAVLMAQPGGVSFRDAYYRGEADPADPLYAQSARDFTKLLRQYTNAGNAALTGDSDELNATNVQWEDAAELLHEGRAAMFLHGNWVKAYLESKGDVADTDFGVAPFPPKAFVYAGDSFMISNNAPHAEAALDFLKMIGSADVQSSFNKIKGALPAREDADISGYDSIGRQAAADFRDPGTTLLPASWDYPPSAYWKCWEAAIVQAVKHPDGDAYAAACVEQYPLLKE